MKLLCAADLHLGRTATRLSPDVDPASHRCAAAWANLVDTAIQQQVSAVLLAGDVIDRDNKYFEALGPLEEGLARLAAADIPVLAVAGNHDWDSLPRFASSDAASHLALLGRGATWQRHTLIDGQGQPALHVDGWSFNTESQLADPLASLTADATAGLPAIGMVHGDLDNARSQYAPLATATLREQPHQLWLLGHVHAPRTFADATGKATIIYPGSPQATDPGEEGVHGAVLVEIEAGQPPRVTPIALSTTQYELLTLDASACETRDQLEQLIFAAVREASSAAAAGSRFAAHLTLRLKLVGRSCLHREADDWLAQLQEQYDPPNVGQLQTFIERITNAMKPAIDLAQLAEGRDLLAMLARYLQQLERSDAPPARDDGLHALVQAAANAATQLTNQPHYQPLVTAADEGDSVGVSTDDAESGQPAAHLNSAAAVADAPEQMARETLQQQGWRLLDVLYSQKGELGDAAAHS